MKETESSALMALMIFALAILPLIAYFGSRQKDVFLLLESGIWCIMGLMMLPPVNTSGTRN